MLHPSLQDPDLHAYSSEDIQDQKGLASRMITSDGQRSGRRPEITSGYASVTASRKPSWILDTSKEIQLNKEITPI